MHELIAQFTDFLRSHGINVDIVIILFAVLLLTWNVRDILRWERLEHHQKHLVVNSIVAATIMLLAGLLFLVVE